MTTLDQALALRSRGLSVIPIQHGGKKPVVKWAWFQTHHATEAQVAAWFGGVPRNIGIATGAISGLVVVDVDSADAHAWAAANLPPTPMRTQTAKGEHWFYRHPGVPVPNRAHVGALALDLRGDGGYVLAPGSLHPSGVLYRAAGTWPAIDDLPMFKPEWLTDSVADEPHVRHGATGTRRQSGRNDLAWL